VRVAVLLDPKLHHLRPSAIEHVARGARVEVVAQDVRQLGPQAHRALAAFVLSRSLGASTPRAISACASVLRLIIVIIEHGELEQRIEALEAELLQPRRVA